MAQAVAEELGRIPMSPALQATLMRAREYASGQSHNQVTVEHLLLALSEDEDATLVLQSSNVDLGRLRRDVADYLGNLGDRSPGPTQPVVSPPLTEILKYAGLAAKQGRRARIDGAIVLAALVGDGRSMAASFLNAQGLTFEAAIRVLQRAPAPTAAPRLEPRQPAAVQPAPQQVQPAPQAVLSQSAPNGVNAEDILAAARERVEQRAPPPRPEPVFVQPSRPSPDAPQATAAPQLAVAQLTMAQAASPNLPMPSGPDGQAQAASKAREWQAAPVQRDASGNAADVAAGDATALQSSPEPPRPLTEPAIATWQPNSPPIVNQPLQPSSPVRPPATTWAPPPLPVPQPQAPSQARMPSPAPSPVRPVLPAVKGPPEWTSRPDPAAEPPWTNPAPRPPMRQPPTQTGQGQGGTPNGYHFTQATGPQGASAPQMAPPLRPNGQLASMPGMPGIYPGEVAATASIEAAQVTHNVPKSMRIGKKVSVEVRIARAAIAGLSGGSRPMALRAEQIAARAITVRLRGTKAAFAIEANSPETQWDQTTSQAGRAAVETAVWRFSVSPLKATRADLHVVASARTVGADGVMADTGLPDQVVTVRIGRDVGRFMRRSAAVSTIAITSIIAVKLIEEFLGFDLMRLVRALTGF